MMAIVIVSVRADHPRAAVAVGDVVGADGLPHANEVLGFFAKERHVRICSKAPCDEEPSCTEMATDTAGVALSSPACRLRARR